MPRPLRIEFENAQYHVMNRGAGKKLIYKTNLHKLLFLELLEDAHKTFGIEIHAYCLMDNHYHLLLKTPHANLARAMRHINGVYTQKYNKLEKTDGALFRGRYKAIIVSYDEYFLNVSRYIHLNPVAAKIVNSPEEYPWSSYQSYIFPQRKPKWLNTSNILSLVNYKNNIKSYVQFIKLGLDKETNEFYEKTNPATIYGSVEFKESLLKTISDKKKSSSSADYNRTITIPLADEIILLSSKIFDISQKYITQGKRGQFNIFRHIAIYACRKWAHETLPNIASLFHCKSHSSLSNIISNLEIEMKENKEVKIFIDRLRDEIFNNRQPNT